MSSTELVARYLGERARPMVFVPLALLIAETAWLAAPGTERTVGKFTVCAMQALVLVLALRIWDDLQDRARDAARHPGRITVRAQRTVPLVTFGAALALGGAMSLIADTVPRTRIAILVATVLGLFVWYRARPSEPSRLAGVVVLAKYPAIAIALAPGLGNLTAVRAAAAAGTLYLIACTYEYLEDRSRGIS